MYIAISKRTKEIIATSEEPFVDWSSNVEVIEGTLPERQYEHSYFIYENGEFKELPIEWQSGN